MMRRLLPVLLALFLACGLVAAGDPTTHAATHAGVSARKPVPRQDYPRLPRYCATHQEKIPSKPVICKLDAFSANHPTIVLWGDSHAWMMIPALRAATKGKGINLVAIVEGDCPPMDPGLSSPDDPAPSCDQANALAIQYTKQLQAGDQKLQVVLGGSWERYYHAVTKHDHSDAYLLAQGLKMRKETPRLFRTLAAAGIPVTVDGQVATVPTRHQPCAAGDLPYSCDLPRHASLPDAKGTRSWLQSFMKPLPGSHQLINVNPTFCTSKVCHGRIGKTHTWFDDLHLSATRSKTLAPYFKPVVDKVLASDSTAPPPPGGGAGGCIIPILLCRPA